MASEEKTNNSDDKQSTIDKLTADVNRVQNRAKELEKLIAQRETEDALNEEFKLEEWQPVQTQYVASYLEKCVLRMNLHEESARYYNRHHYYVIIPATILGAVSSTTAFTQWSTKVLSDETNIMWLFVGIVMAITTLLHDLSEFVFAFKDKARQHQQSFINFSRLVKRIDNEYNNPAQEHRPYRQFIQSISEDYDRYTEHALMVPDAVNNMFRKRLIQTLKQDETPLRHETRNSPQHTVQTVADADPIEVKDGVIKRKKKKKTKEDKEHRELTTEMEAHSVAAHLQRNVRAAISPPALPPLHLGVSSSRTPEESDELIERFKIRNQMLRQNREARRMTLTQFYDSNNNLPLLMKERSKREPFQPAPHDHVKRPHFSQALDTLGNENLSVDSMIELSSLDQSKKDRNVRRDSVFDNQDNDNDDLTGFARSKKIKQRANVRRSSLPPLRTGIVDKNKTDRNNMEEGDTPEELNSIQSGIVHYNNEN